MRLEVSDLKVNFIANRGEIREFLLKSQRTSLYMSTHNLNNINKIVVVKVKFVSCGEKNRTARDKGGEGIHEMSN